MRAHGRFSDVTTQVRLLVAGMVALVAVAGIAGLAGVAVATSTVNRLADELVPAADANEAVLQDMTDAETGLRGWVATGDRTFLQPYYAARADLAVDQRHLREYAEAHRELLSEVREQDSAVRDWFDSYAVPRLADPAGPGHVSHQRLLFGKTKFDRIRVANTAVQQELNRAVNDARLSAFQELPWIVVVLLLVAFAGAVAALFARRVALRITEPLVDMERTVDRLAAGDLEARALVGGPREVRRVGEALNNFADRNARVLELEREAVERLQALDRAKTDFVSTVSHELRTPLTSIAGYVELFEDGFIDEISPQQRGMLTIVNRNVQRLRNLIEDLLTLSQAESEAFRTSFDLLDLNHLVSDVAHDLRPTAAQRDITLTEVLAPRAMVARGDPAQLSRALLNLVSNAVKFSHDGGEVVLRVRQVGADAVVEVVDHGIGIPAADMPSLATRFFRARNAVDAEIGGTGLGLRIVHTVMDNHGGRLVVESVEGEGTSARMVVPLASDTVPDAVRRASDRDHAAAVGREETGVPDG
jgi:signal transduction histidine kinase